MNNNNTKRTSAATIPRSDTDVSDQILDRMGHDSSSDDNTEMSSDITSSDASSFVEQIDSTRKVEPTKTI